MTNYNIRCDFYVNQEYNILLIWMIGLSWMSISLSLFLAAGLDEVFLYGTIRIYMDIYNIYIIIFTANCIVKLFETTLLPLQL